MKPLTIRPTTAAAVAPGTSITFTFGATLPATVGTEYKIAAPPVKANHAGTEEVIFNIGGTAFAAVDVTGQYVTSQMLNNPDRTDCPLMENGFFVRIVDNGATPAVMIFRGLSRRFNTIQVLTPPTP